MLSERVQRAMMGSILMVVLYLFNIQEMMIASVLLTGMIILVSIWAVFDFCPSLWTLRKLLKEEEECQQASLRRES